MKRSLKLLGAALLSGCCFSSISLAKAQENNEVWTYWDSGFELRAITALINESNKNFPDTPVYKRAITGNTKEMRRALQVGFMGGNLPVAYQSALGQELKNFVDSDRLTPIDDIWQQVKGDAVFPKSLSRVITINGKHYGIPMNIYTINNVYYNKKIFDQLNLKAPTSWQEFADVNAALKKAGYSVLSNASGTSWTLYNLYAPLISVMGQEGYFRLASGKVSFTDPQVRQAFELFTKIYADNYMKSWSGYTTWSSAADPFVQGKVAMYQMGDWLSAYLQEKGMKPGKDYDFFTAPGLDNAVIAQVDIIALPKNSAEKERAGKNFLLTAASTAGQSAFNAAKGSVAANVEVPDDIYGVLNKKVHANILAANKNDKVLPNLQFMLPVTLGDELGNQLESYAQNPSPKALDVLLKNMETMRQQLLTDGKFVNW